MRNKSNLHLAVIILAYIVLFIILCKLNLVSMITLFIISAIYLVLAIVTYKELRRRFANTCYKKSIAFLSNQYIEVKPIHPLLLAAKYHMLFEKDIKVYAKSHFGYIINVKIVSKKSIYKIENSDWIWFYTNFKEKEPD